MKNTVVKQNKLLRKENKDTKKLLKEENGLIEKDKQKLHNYISDFYELILKNHLIFLKQCIISQTSI